MSQQYVAVLAARVDRQRFQTSLALHLRRRGLAWLTLLGAAAWFNLHYGLGLNATHSLPGHLYLIEKGQAPRRGDCVAFRWTGGGPYPAGTIFIKTLAGLPGDMVEREGPRFRVNGRPMGEAKTHTRFGEPLEPGPTGTIPEGRFFVHAPHPDSLDSRYAMTGWIGQAQILGRARALF